jgi:hypothetical protein
MLYGCLFDLLRLLLLGLALVCVLLFGATAWLGPNYSAFVPVTVSPDVQFDVEVRGPSPDLDVTVIRHVLFREILEPWFHVRLRALPLALTTMFLTAVVWLLDWLGWQQTTRS